MASAAVGSVDFAARFSRLADRNDGTGLHALLRASESRTPAVASSAPSAGCNPTAADLLRAQQAGATEDGLDAQCSALKTWCARYLSGTSTRWMVIPMLWLAGRPRRLAAELDRAGRTDRHQKKLVEALREQFQKLHRDRRKREGALAVCCELLRLYFGLGQASQCTFLLAAVSQAQKGEPLDYESLPRALAVTLCFLWGKHCVLDGDVVEAEEKLGWALAHCPPGAANRRIILSYLVPIRLRLGRTPAQKTLKTHKLDNLAGIVRAVADGDVQRFNREFEEHEVELIRLGTYLVVEKLKLLVYRNLCRCVHSSVVADLEKAGKVDQRHKQDLTPYERAFEWQDGCDADETICILAHLIHMGAIRGYMSDEHRKIVFSKDAPFPAASTWSPKV